VPRVFC